MIGALFRFGFVVACSCYVLGIGELAAWRGLWVAMYVAFGGLVVAILLAEDWQQERPPARAPEPGGGIRHRPWRRTSPYESEEA